MTSTERRKTVAEHYRRVSNGLEGINAVSYALGRLDTDRREELDALFGYLYKNKSRSVVSASLEFNMSTASVYRRLSLLCGMLGGDGKIHAKISIPSEN